MRNLKIILAYDGSNFHGWQFQTAMRTVQETVEKSLQDILGHEVRVTASGRTDAGVHALGQVINFRTRSRIPAHGLLRALNTVFPPDLSAREVREVSPDFHARYLAISKKYVYVVDISTIPSPFLSRYVMNLPGGLDVQAMRQAAHALKGQHDFSSFMGAGSSVKTTVREIFDFEIFGKGSRVFFCIRGSGFLRHMVRNIVGTLIPVGQAEMTPRDVERILGLRDRTQAGPTAPPQGLYLVEVEYGGHGKSSDTDTHRRQGGEPGTGATGENKKWLEEGLNDEGRCAGRRSGDEAASADQGDQ
ncbi:MAG TPA: tRNA pseudouridine(38-40) synthase TruA [Deltaproteobacteria bacterium]|nr:tRNA pseudouridine(38-40) synthase TruA [Deltaproteobacteria bacterium]